MKNLFLPIVSCLSLAACSQSDEAAPDTYTYAEEQHSILNAFGWADFEAAELRTVKLHNGMAVIFGYGGNILASVGEDGVLLIDDQFPELQGALLKELEKLGGNSVDYVINTHWHFDHAEGNRAFGPLGATIIAHANSRKYMSQPNDINLVYAVYPQQAYEADALPTISFTETMKLYLNGNDIELYHFGPAHTAGDAVVYFRQSNVLHMGDIAVLSGSPFIDAGNGGTIDGLIFSIREVLKFIDDDTIIIPGHGEIADKGVIEEHLLQLETVRDRVASLKSQGLTLEEVVAQNPAKEFFGDAGFLLVNRAFVSIP